MVQARITANKRVVSRPTSEYLLAGIIYCGHCDAAMSGGVDHRNEARGGKPWRFYRCNTKRQIGQAACPGRAVTGADAIERKVVAGLLDSVLTLDHLRELLAEMLKHLGGPDLEREIEQCRIDITRTRRTVDNMVNAMAESGTQSPAAGKRLAELEGELGGYEANMRSLLDRSATANQVITDAQLQAVVDRMRSDVQSEEIAVARRALRAFVSRVGIKDDLYRVEYQVAQLLAFTEVPPRGYHPQASNALEITAASYCVDCGIKISPRSATQVRCAGCQDRHYFRSYYQRNREAIIERVKRNQKQ